MDMRPKQGIRVNCWIDNRCPDGLVDRVDRFLCHGIEGCHCLGIRLESALRDNQIGELLRDVDIRGFGFATFNGAAATRPGHAHRRASRGGAGLIIVRSHARQALLVVHLGHCQLANRLVLTIGVNPCNGAVRTDGKSIKLARRVSILVLSRLAC